MLDAVAFGAFVHPLLAVWAPLSRGARTRTTMVCTASCHLRDVILLDLIGASFVDINIPRRWSLVRHGVAVSIHS